MLQTIREHAQGWVIRSVIAIIVIAFTFWGIHGYFVGSSGNSTVAVVNGTPITKDQLAVAYERMRRQAQIQYGANHVFTNKDELVLKQRALQTLTEIEALKQESLRSNFLISDRQIDNYLESMPEFQVNGRFSVQRFQEVLASTLLSTSDFFELIRTSLLIDQPRLGVLLSSFAVPEETRYTISLVNQDRDFDYLVLPVQLFQSQIGGISDDKLKRYYDAHKALFMTPEQVSVEYVVLSLKDIVKKITPPTDAVLRTTYNDNINSYTVPTTWRLTGIEIPVSVEASNEEWDKALQEAKKLAITLSNDTVFTQYQKKYPLSSAVDTEFLALNQFPDTWQKPVSSLQKKGQLSTPIKSTAGIVILKALEVRAAHTPSFDEVKEKVQSAYIHQRAEEQFALMRDQLSELTYQHPDSLKMAQEKLGLAVLDSGLFAKEPAGAGILSHKKIRDVAFSDDVLTMKNNSDVISVDTETAVVLRLKTHLKSTLLPLETVKKQIEDKLKNQLVDGNAKQLVHADLQQLRSGTVSREMLATKYKLQWKSSGLLGRYTSKIDSAILELVFSLPRPTAQNNNVTYGITRLRDRSYVLVALKSVKDGALPDDKQLAVFGEQVQNSEGLLEYELLKRSILANTKIEITEN